MHVSQCKPEKKRKTQINLSRTGDSRVRETRCKFIKEVQKTKKVRQQMEKVQKPSNPKKRPYGFSYTRQHFARNLIHLHILILLPKFKAWPIRLTL